MVTSPPTSWPATPPPGSCGCTGAPARVGSPVCGWWAPAGTSSPGCSVSGTGPATATATSWPGWATSLRMYRGNGTGGWVSPYPTIGTGWNSIRFPGEGRATTGSTCTNPYFTTSSSNGGVTDGGYYVHNNLW